MGKAGTPEDGRRNNGKYPKPWAGRKPLAPGESKARGIHQIRAHEKEWELIQRFIKLVRKNPAACEKMVRILED